ncbi:MAG: diacylglycerol/polyprenol kinase family protein, partial [Candidatus Micrarchaeia archaeon]
MRRWGENALMYIFILSGLILFEFENVNVFFNLTVLITFNILISIYGSKKFFFFALLALLFLPFANSIIFAQGAFLGMLPEVVLMKGKNLKKDKRLEVKRDIIHLGAGAAVLAIACIFSFWGRSIILALVLIGFVLGNYIRLSGKPSIIARLEREYTPFGYGAIWLALGITVTMGLLFSNAYMLAVLSTILIGDPLATIMGVKFGRIRIPHNKEKSVAGSLAYFFSVLIISYFFVGYFAAVIAIAASLIE